MKNKFVSIFSAVGLVLALGSVTTSCSVEDGVDGVNGINGTNGVDGINGSDGADGADGVDGTDGANGADGIGFDEFDDYGSILLNLQGTRPDDVAFNHEAELKFITTETDENNVEFNDPDIDFEFVRQLKSPDSHQSNGVYIYLDVNDAGLATQDFDFEIYFSEYAIFSDDLKYIELDDDYDATDTGVSNFTITNYNFDDTTNNLTFSFAMDVDGANNETENDLSISGTVDVIVFEEVYSNN